MGYNREKALDYAGKWAYSRNPAYLDYSDIGGDCTNFISQCIYAGSNVMNYSTTNGWYYSDGNNKSPSWTGVKYLFNFLTTNTGAGPYGTETDADWIELGDILQLGDSNGNFYHSGIITKIQDNRIFISTHSFDSHMRALDTYIYHRIRFVHIEGVRKR